MSLASDIYFELTLAGLAPSVPFCAAPEVWWEAIERGVKDGSRVEKPVTHRQWLDRQLSIAELKSVDKK